MVTIRLKRGGAKKRPHYRVIAIDKRARRDGRALEYLGAYNPLTQPSEIRLEVARIEHWVAQGAQLSRTVQNLLRQARKQQPGAAAAETAEDKNVVEATLEATPEEIAAAEESESEAAAENAAKPEA